MTARGPIKLARYASGGVATGPQLALFGEGSKNEAFVPLPDGRSIPVTMRGGNAGGVVINSTVNVNATGGTERQNDDLARRVGQQVKDNLRGLVTDEIRLQMRPGNLLSAGAGQTSFA